MATYSNFLLSRDQKHVFCYVPKVACTNWKCLIRQSYGAEDWLDPGVCHDRQKSGLRYLDINEPRDFRLLSIANSRTVMVRNPFTRALSAYLDKIRRRINNGVIQQTNQQNDAHWMNIIRELTSFSPQCLNNPDEKAMFTGFLHWLANSGHAWTRDEHWAPQVKISAFDVVQFQVVAKFEALPTSATQIMELMGISEKFPTQEEVKFPKNQAGSKLEQYYDKESEALVLELFYDDFIAFDYPTRL